nr:IS630 family transposase [Geminisphaera colitermitum]
MPPDNNAAFAAAMEDVLEVYRLPHDPRFPVVCMDESSKQMVGEVKPPIPAAPGHAQIIDHEYVRNGVARLLVEVEPLTGRRHVEVSERRTQQDWARFIKGMLDERYPKAAKVRLVVDNLNIHSIASLYETFPPAEARRLAEKLEIHYTPIHGSWLNIAEIELSALSRQCLDRRIPDITAMRREVAAWQQHRNQRGAPINWRFTTEDARIKLIRLYPKL